MLLLLIIHTTVMLIVTAQHNLTPFGRATQSSSMGHGDPRNALHPPISNAFSFSYCTHTSTGETRAWWMFQYLPGIAHITDITIYYGKNFAFRMDGFALYVTNTSTIPPNGYLCYKDTDPGFPNITQTISCNQLGKYVIFDDTTGDDQNGPLIQLCYVEINGCKKSFWGTNCERMCSENCIERHCYPGNGSCVWGCNAKNCLNGVCNKNTGVCSGGCKKRRTGNYCNQYNMASDGLVLQTPLGSEPVWVANDGNKTSCSKTKATNVTFQVDLRKIGIVTGIFMIFGELSTKEGTHTVYASNTSTSWKLGTILYEENTLPSDINFTAVFRYLTYVPPVQDISSELEVCEIGIIGCPPSNYGPVCNESCPLHCHGPCDLDTGLCTFGCLNGWTGDKCERACQPGTYGKNCLEKCSQNCLTPPCNTWTGECIGGCHDGWQGFDCKQKCSHGQFGRNCTELCGGCLLSMCNVINGLCDNTTACNPGYVYGNYCNTICNGGLYGSNCLQICSPFCLYQPCDRGTGECIGGCIRGLQGFNCTQVSANTAEEVSPASTQIGLFTGGFLVGAMISPIMCYLIMKKRQLLKKGKENATRRTHNHEQQNQDDVGMENVSTYEDLHTDSTSNAYDQINTTYVNQ